MKEPKNYLGKAKKWNFFILITSCLSALLGIGSIVKSFTDTLEDYSVYEKYAQKMFDYNTGIAYRGFLIFNFGVLVFLIFRYFKTNQLLAAGESAPKYPYYVAIAMMVLNFLFGQFVTPQVELIEGLQLGAITAISGVVSVLITAIPPLFALINLFKGDTETNN